MLRSGADREEPQAKVCCRSSKRSDLASRREWDRLGSYIVKARGDHIIGVAEALLLHREALLLVSFIRHWVEVGDDACNRLVIAFLMCSERVRIRR